AANGKAMCYLPNTQGSGPRRSPAADALRQSTHGVLHASSLQSILEVRYRRGFLDKRFSSASHSACVRSGSRPLSGSNRTTGELASVSLPAAGCSGTALSRQRARVFSQKICAATLPFLALANK